MLRHSEERESRPETCASSSGESGSGREQGRGSGRERGCADRPALSRRPDPRRVRLYALTAAVAGALAVPLAVASAGQVGDRGDTAPRAAVRPLAHGDDKLPSADSALPRPSPRAGAGGAAGAGPLLLGLGLATAARCGPEVSSPEGVEAQTCVLTQGPDTWARTYYRNATGEHLVAALTLMGPGDRTVRTRCSLGGDDEPGTCETPREHTRDAAAYTAVAEFARAGGVGPLLLRSGSNSPVPNGG
jgi:hypothetical protein